MGTKDYSLLYETSKLINSTLDLDTIMQNIVTIVVRKLHYDDFSILFMRKDQLYLEKGYRHPKGKISDYQMNMIKGITGKAARTGKPIMVNHVQKNSQYIPVRPGTKSELAVPIKIDNKVFGVFNVEAKKTNAFDELEGNFLRIKK